MAAALIPTAYLGPVQHYCKLAQYSQVVIEKYEHYRKQTFRNRCEIYGANGKLLLTVPLQRGKNEHQNIKDVKISYDFNWQDLHWKSIETAYRSSPFFEYYEDHFLPFYEEEIYEYLFDFNEALEAKVLELLQISPEREYTVDYLEYYEGMDDYRNIIHPKSNRSEPDPGFIPKEYVQVFSERHGFLPNLSIIDLLFNEGPGAVELLR